MKARNPIDGDMIRRQIEACAACAEKDYHHYCCDTCPGVTGYADEHPATEKTEEKENAEDDD